MKNYDWVTDEMFDAKLVELLAKMTAQEILQIPGVYEEVSEHLNNQALDELERENPVRVRKSGSGHVVEVWTDGRGEESDGDPEGAAQEDAPSGER